MAWQQKGSGHVYNSQSGHGTLMGLLTRKVVGLSIKCKICNICDAFERRINKGMYEEGEEPLEPEYHWCYKNYVGSSGSMEAAACLELVVNLYDKANVSVGRLCCDDDSSVRADCQWSNEDYLRNNNTTELPFVAKTVGKNKGELQIRPDKGKLPPQVPQPRFVADPNHRRKGLTGELIKLELGKKEFKGSLTRMDCTRIGKNFGYMARTLQRKPESEFVATAQAVLEHHFDNHEYCGDWCRRKSETEEQRKSSNKFYRNKTTKESSHLYGLLAEKVQRFTTLDRLIEMAHGLDTNMNEAFNQICTWFAPKNKVFAGSGSLNNRISFAVGINSVGLEVFYKRLCKKLGIEVTESIDHFLRIKEAKRANRLAEIRTRTAKIKKNKRKYDKLKADTRLAKLKNHKEQGTYRKGMNLDDPYCQLADEEEDNSNGQPKANNRTKSNASSQYCEYCGSKGHATVRSVKCKAHGNNNAPKIFSRATGQSVVEGATTAALPNAPELQAYREMASMDDADDMDEYDSLPFDQFPDEADVHDCLFHRYMQQEAEANGSDDDSVQMVGGTL
jgi:hypothetical protein